MKCCQVNVKCQTHSASSTGPPHKSLIRGLGHPLGLRWCTFIRRLHLLFNHVEANVADVMRTVVTLNSFWSICLPLSGVCSLGSNSRQWKHTSTVQLFFINRSEILLLLDKKVEKKHWIWQLLFNLCRRLLQADNAWNGVVRLKNEAGAVWTVWTCCKSRCYCQRCFVLWKLKPFCEIWQDADDELVQWGGWLIATMTLTRTKSQNQSCWSLTHGGTAGDSVDTIVLLLLSVTASLILVV